MTPTAMARGRCSMLIPVGVLTVLAAIGGLLVIPGVWEPFLTWIDEVAEPLVDADGGAGLRDERRRGGARRRRHLARPTARSAAGRELVADGAVRDARSSTSSTSTSCTTPSSPAPCS